MKAINVAHFIIANQDHYGDLITNKKLQKLLYYTEAWGLVHLDGIIDEDFEAWVHGPVIPSIYHNYSKYGYSPIKNDDIKDYKASSIIENFKKENRDIYDLINIVLKKYGTLTSLELELLSHSEKPWVLARKKLKPFENGGKDNIINKSIMREFYSGLISK